MREWLSLGLAIVGLTNLAACSEGEERKAAVDKGMEVVAAMRAEELMSTFPGSGPLVVRSMWTGSGDRVCGIAGTRGGALRFIERTSASSKDKLVLERWGAWSDEEWREACLSRTDFLYEQPVVDGAYPPIGNVEAHSDSVLVAAERQYQMAKRHGGAVDACVQAGIVAAGYLQEENETGYRRWKEVEKAECAEVAVAD